MLVGIFGPKQSFGGLQSSINGSIYLENNTLEADMGVRSPKDGVDNERFECIGLGLSKTSQIPNNQTTM